MEATNMAVAYSHNGTIIRQIDTNPPLERVFYTTFSNLSNGVDTPIIGSSYNTVLEKQIAQETALKDVTTVGRVSSNPNGDKLLIDFTNYIQGKKRAVLEFLVKVYSCVSYATNVFYVNSTSQIRLPASTDGFILLLTSDNTGVYVKNSVFNDRVQISAFSGYNYTKDRWMPVKYEYNFENKSYDMYLYGIKTLTKSFNSTQLQLRVSLWDGVSLDFTDVSLWT